MLEPLRIDDNSFNESAIADSNARLASLLKYLNEILVRMTLPPDEGTERIRLQLGKALSKEALQFSGSPAIFYALSSTLYHKIAPTMGELSRTLLIPLSTTTRLVDWWVNNGFAQRFSDPEDRRIVRVSLTDDGKKLHEVAERFIAANVRKCLVGLTPKEQLILLTLVRKAAQSLKQD